MAQDVIVTIKRLPDDPSGCSVDPDPFVTTRGSTVTFKFAFDTPDGHVVFNGPSPFDNEQGMEPRKFLQSRAHMVVRDPGLETFKCKYKVIWSGGAGSGDGQGEVTPP
jgi:hypothetical protein